MGFIEEIKNCFSSEELPKEPIFRAVMFGDCAVYFENVCSISHYCQEEICLCLKKNIFFFDWESFPLDFIRLNNAERMETMKIAVTCENGLVFQHFGKTPELFEL